MPQLPACPCRYPGCAELVFLPNRYCRQHSPQIRRLYDSRRKSSQVRGYNSHWAKIREFYLKAHPLCEDCEQYGLVVMAEIVHHKDGDPLNNNQDNLIALCRACHGRFHRQINNKKGKGDIKNW